MKTVAILRNAAWSLSQHVQLRYHTQKVEPRWWKINLQVYPITGQPIYEYKDFLIVHNESDFSNDM